MAGIRGGRKSGGVGGYSDRSGGGNYSDGDPEKGKRSLDLTDDEDLGLPKSLQNSPGNKTTIFKKQQKHCRFHRSPKVLLYIPKRFHHSLKRLPS